MRKFFLSSYKNHNKNNDFMRSFLITSKSFLNENFLYYFDNTFDNKVYYYNKSRYCIKWRN